MIQEAPPVVKAMHDLILAWVRQVEHVPRLHRYSLGSRVTECLLNAQQSILSGRVIENRLLAIQGAQAAFEVRTRANKFFRIDRISSAELTDKPYLFQLEHRASLPDMFGFALPDEGEAMMYIKLDLSMRAALFMRTEHPLSIP